MRSWNSERGMSLVEATIILMVLAILTSVLAPSIGDYVNDARQTKAKEDLEALGTSVARLVRDTGLPFPVRTAGDCYERYLIRMAEMRESTRIVRQVLDRMPAGDIQLRDRSSPYDGPAPYQMRGAM